jgi:hypothetical protein
VLQVRPSNGASACQPHRCMRAARRCPHPKPRQSPPQTRSQSARHTCTTHRPLQRELSNFRVLAVPGNRNMACMHVLDEGSIELTIQRRLARARCPGTVRLHRLSCRGRTNASGDSLPAAHRPFKFKPSSILQALSYKERRHGARLHQLTPAVAGGQGAGRAGDSAI